MMNLKMSIRMDARQAYITCWPFGLKDAPLEVSTSGHLVLDLTTLRYCPVGPAVTTTPGVTFATSEVSAQTAQPVAEDTENTHVTRHQRPTQAMDWTFRRPISMRQDRWSRLMTDCVSGQTRYRQNQSCCLHLRSLNRLPETVNKQRLLAKARSRLVERMRDDATLRSLHLKHYHMSLLQLRRRTSHLGLPADVFERFERIVKTCEYCMKTKPAPQRSRVSGLRSEVFGDLVFLDHGQVKVHSSKFLFLIVLDGATGFTAVYPQTTLEPEETIANIHEWMDTYQCTPKAVCADMAFHTPKSFQDFYRLHSVKPLPTGPATPWPNRAEAAVRLFKQFFQSLVHEVLKNPNLKHVTVRQLMRKAASARNTTFTWSGKNPVGTCIGPTTS